MVDALPSAHYLRVLYVPGAFLEGTGAEWLTALCCVRTRVALWPEHYMRGDGIEPGSNTSKLVYGESGEFEYLSGNEGVASVALSAYTTICEEAVFGETDCQRAIEMGCTPPFLDARLRRSVPTETALGGGLALALGGGLAVGGAVGALLVLARHCSRHGRLKLAKRQPA